MVSLPRAKPAISMHSAPRSSKRSTKANTTDGVRLNIPATTAGRPFGRFAVVEEAVEGSGARDVFGSSRAQTLLAFPNGVSGNRPSSIYRDIGHFGGAGG